MFYLFLLGRVYSPRSAPSKFPKKLYLLGLEEALTCYVLVFLRLCMVLQLCTGQMDG